MAHLNKQDFDENVHVYVDKTKTEILNSFSQVLKDNDKMYQGLTKSHNDIEKIDQGAKNEIYLLKTELNGVKSINADYEVMISELNIKENNHRKTIIILYCLLIISLIVNIIFAING